MKRDLAGHRALVTGASSGIGAAFGRLLAARGADLVLTARREERLRELADELRERHGVQVLVVPADLAEPEAPRALFEAATAAAPVTMLVNNAGFGLYSEFRRASWERQQALIRLNVLALVELTHRFLSARREREATSPAYVLNVASIAAFQPVPGMAVYGASKAFVRDFSEALAHEVRHEPVHVCCLSPGATRTEFFDVADQPTAGLVRRSTMSAERCAEIGLSALLRGRRSVVAGSLNSVAAWMTRFVPRRASARLAETIIEEA